MVIMQDACINVAQMTENGKVISSQFCKLK